MHRLVKISLQPAWRPKNTRSNSARICYTMWGPPAISWFISPSNYSYKSGASQCRICTKCIWRYRPPRAQGFQGFWDVIAMLQCSMHGTSRNTYQRDPCGTQGPFWDGSSSHADEKALFHAWFKRLEVENESLVKNMLHCFFFPIAIVLCLWLEPKHGYRKGCHFE
jgi:hypothetical protein